MSVFVLLTLIIKDLSHSSLFIFFFQMFDSQIGAGGHPNMGMASGNINTPRILELDINRMMIGQNTIRYVVQWI